MKKLVYGVGINDADYVVDKKERINGKQKRIWICPYYKTWKHMLERAYSEKLHERRPTYKDVTVCEDWLRFSNFKAWMKQQDWECKQLDKDIINPENKVYSPDTCVFISSQLNSLLTHKQSHNTSGYTGVSWDKRNNKYKAHVTYKGKVIYLGYFDNPESGYEAYIKRKSEIIQEYIDNETDEHIINGLKMHINKLTI